MVPATTLLPTLHSFPAISRPRTLVHRRRLLPCAAIRTGSFRADGDSFTEKSGYLFSLGAWETASLASYDAAKIATVFRRRPLLVARRLFQIASTFGKWLALRYSDALAGRSDEMFKVRAAELRNILVELGPAYIKIAQAISSRADLVPPAYLDELSLLQDRISPFSTEVAFNMIEQELGLPIEEVFSEISPEPVAAASLGQVFQARLRKNGKVVAVKVQRPGVQAAISLDIFILRFLAGVAKKARKLNTDLQRSPNIVTNLVSFTLYEMDTMAVVDEWGSSLFREMDYKLEAKNGVKFRQLYGNLQDVVVPEMYTEQTTQRVLVMEWIEGQKLSEVKDLYLIEVGVYCSFNQLLEYGFYHADPHPGNLLRTYDGKLAYIDFGMMGEFKEELRDGFIEACLHLVNRDFDALATDFVTLGLLPPTSNNEAVTKALTGVFQKAVDRGVRNISFGDLLGNLGVTMYEFKFRIPSYFSLVIRSLAVLEGIAVSANPQYKVLGSTYPWIAKKVLTDSSPKLKASLQALLYEEGVFRIDRLESLLSESLRARTDKDLAQEQEASAYSRAVVKQVLSFMLTEKGSFVRDILLQELAKGLDALGVAVSSAAIARLPFGLFPITKLTDEDRTNLTTLRRLFNLLARLEEKDHSVAGDSNNRQEQNLEDMSLVINQLVLSQEVLPILSVISELPQESQQQLLNLPADLSRRLLSRVAARTIRRFVF